MIRHLKCNSAYLNIWQNGFIINIDKFSYCQQSYNREIFCQMNSYTVIDENDNGTYLCLFF